MNFNFTKFLKMSAVCLHFSDDDDDDSDEVDNDHDGPEEDGLEDEEELEDEFDEYGHSLHHHPGYNTRIITTVPAKEPSMSAVPLKSAMKKPKNGTVAHSKYTLHKLEVYA